MTEFFIDPRSRGTQTREKRLLSATLKQGNQEEKDMI